MLALWQIRGVTGALQTSIVEVFAKLVSNVDIRMLTILVKAFILPAWVQNMPLQANAEQFLKFKVRCFPDSK